MAHAGDSVSKCKAQIEKLTAMLKKAREEKKGACDLPSSKEGKGVSALAPHQLKQRKLLRGHFGKVYAMSWCNGDAKDELLVSASQDGKLIVWDAVTTNKRMLIPLRSAWVMTVAFSASGNLLACGGLDNVCSVYKYVAGPLDEKGREPTPTHELAKHEGYLSSCKFIGSDDRRLVSASGDGSVILWDVAGQRPTQTFLGHGSDVMTVTPTDGAEGGDVFISGGCDSLALVWDARTGTCVQTHDGHESDINSIAIFPEQYAFGTASDDSTCRLFDRRCWGQLNAFQNSKVVTSITSVAFSSSGRYLFAGLDDYSTQIWDTIRGTLVSGELTPKHDNRVSCLGVNKSGSALCTGSWDSLLKCWG